MVNTIQDVGYEHNRKSLVFHETIERCTWFFHENSVSHDENVANNMSDYK